MEYDLKEIFYFIKEQFKNILFFVIVIFIIYILCILSNNLLFKIKKINNINDKINNTKDKINNIQQEINYYKDNIDDLSSQIFNQMQINKSINSEYNLVNKQCKNNTNNFTTNLKKLSIKLPKDIKNDMYSLINKMLKEKNKRNNDLYNSHLYKIKYNKLKKQKLLNDLYIKQNDIRKSRLNKLSNIQRMNRFK